MQLVDDTRLLKQISLDARAANVRGLIEVDLDQLACDSGRSIKKGQGGGGLRCIERHNMSVDAGGANAGGLVEVNLYQLACESIGSIKKGQREGRGHTVVAGGDPPPHAA